MDWKSPFLKLGGSVWPKMSRTRGFPHQPFFVSEKVNEFSFIWYKNVGGTFVRFHTIHACDGQTEGQTDTFAIGKTACIQCSAVKSTVYRGLSSLTLTYTTPDGGLTYTNTTITIGLIWCKCKYYTIVIKPLRIELCTWERRWRTMRAILFHCYRPNIVEMWSWHSFIRHISRSINVFQSFWQLALHLS